MTQESLPPSKRKAVHFADTETTPQEPARKRSRPDHEDRFIITTGERRENPRDFTCDVLIFNKNGELEYSAHSKVIASKAPHMLGKLFNSVRTLYTWRTAACSLCFDNTSFSYHWTFVRQDIMRAVIDVIKSFYTGTLEFSKRRIFTYHQLCEYFMVVKESDAISAVIKEHIDIDLAIAYLSFYKKVVTIKQGQEIDHYVINYAVEHAANIFDRCITRNVDVQVMQYILEHIRHKIPPNTLTTNIMAWAGDNTERIKCAISVMTRTDTINT
jgi:hypothetical protein